jgi:hypothetical protein
MCSSESHVPSTSFSQASGPASLATQVRSRLEDFKRILDHLNNADEPILLPNVAEAIQAQNDRFKLWCALAEAHYSRRRISPSQAKPFYTRPSAQVLAKHEVHFADLSDIRTGKPLPWEKLSDSGSNGEGFGTHGSRKGDTTELQQLVKSLDVIHKYLMRLTAAHVGDMVHQDVCGR